VATMSRGVPSIKRGIKHFAIALADKAIGFEGFQFLLECADISNLVENGHVHQGSRAHDREAKAARIQGIINFSDQ